MKLFCNAFVIVMSLTAAACVSGPSNDGSKVPKIVEVFACSDLCPGLPSQYIKRVYDGITDEEECRKLCGKPYTYIGWGERTVCEVR